MGDKVLALLLIPYQPLKAQCSGPYAITKMCHVNILKAYQQHFEETPDTTNHPEIPSHVLCLLVLKDDCSSTSAELVVGKPKIEKLRHIEEISSRTPQLFRSIKTGGHDATCVSVCQPISRHT